MIRILFVFLLSFTYLFSQSGGVILEKDNSYSDFKLEMYEDTSASLKLEDIQNIDTFTSATNRFTTGYSKSVFWFKFKVKNTTDAELQRIFKFSNSFVDKLDFYIVSDDAKYTKYQYGAGYFKDSQLNELKKPEFPLSLASGESKTIYFSMFGHFPNYGTLFIFEHKDLHEYILEFDMLYALYIGALLALILYNLFIYFFSRDISYLYYVLYTLFFLLWQLQQNAYYPFGTFQSSFSYYATSSFIPIFFTFFILFSRSILQTKELLPKIDKYLLIYMYIQIVLSLTTLFFLRESYAILNALATVILPFLVYIGVKSYMKGNKTALFYIVAHGGFLVTSSMFSLMTDGYIQNNPITRHGLVFGSFFEIILFSFALAYRIKILQNETIDIVHNTNKKLEQKVKERTAELVQHQTDLENKVQVEVEKSRDKDKFIFHQSKLAAMGEMIENIAHQWRQPLSQVNSAVMIIDDELAQKNITSKAIEDKLSEIENLTQYMSKTINDFRNFFDENKPQEEFPLSDAVDKSINIIQSSLTSHKINLKRNFDESIVLNGYPNELQQVVLVILNNAKDVLISESIKNPQIILKTYATLTDVMIEISDNAGGLKEEIIEKIFEPYYSTKGKSQGTGLGLYISKMIIEDSFLGELYAKSSQEETIFTVKLSKSLI